MSKHEDGWDKAGRPDPIPEDVVRYGEPSRAERASHYRRMNDRTGESVDLNWPGEPIEDVDGNLIGMTPAKTGKAAFLGAWVTRGELARAGLTPEDVPNLRIIDVPTQDQEDQ